MFNAYLAAFFLRLTFLAFLSPSSSAAGAAAAFFLPFLAYIIERFGVKMLVLMIM
jgi:hypothetical protein